MNMTQAQGWAVTGFQVTGGESISLLLSSASQIGSVAASDPFSNVTLPEHKKEAELKEIRTSRIQFSPASPGSDQMAYSWCQERL